MQAEAITMEPAGSSHAAGLNCWDGINLLQCYNGRVSEAGQLDAKEQSLQLLDGRAAGAGSMQTNAICAEAVSSCSEFGRCTRGSCTVPLQSCRLTSAAGLDEL